MHADLSVYNPLELYVIQPSRLVPLVVVLITEAPS